MTKYNTENLKPFKPGKSGNPKGRPKGVPNKATQEVKEIARALVDDQAYRDMLKLRLQNGTAPPAIEVLMWHYARGKPKETLAVEGDVGEAGVLVIRVKSGE